MTAAARLALRFHLARRPDDPVHAHLRRDHPHLLAAAARLDPSPPLPRTIRGHDESWLRLPEHYRSVLRPLDGGGVLVLKGAEPALADFAELIAWMAATTFRGPSNAGHAPMLEHLALRERKVPGALTLREAEREATVALHVQALHLAHYGELARLPVPLAIHTFSGEALQAAARAWRAHLSPAAQEHVREHLAAGLAVYAYAYLGWPVRARSYTRRLPGEDEPARRRRIEAYDVATIIDRWTRLLIRLLYLGYMPYSYHNEGLGACFDAGNACLDGGFVDVDSLTPIAGLRDDGEVFDALVASLAGLDRTIERLLPDDCERETREVLRRGHVWACYRRALDSEARPGLRLDPRVREAIEPLEFPRLVHRLRSRRRSGGDFLA
ncbi:MAG: hypothetical protein JNL82_16285 [Myxococcales bacterium]|nr:hypothetical protein [Myxococcales bacterium]